MKPITKLIYAALAAVTLAIGSVTVNGAVNDLFASINGNGENGGSFIYQYTPTGVQSIFASGLNHPRGVASDHSGNLFVATATFDGSAYHGAIVKITPDGVQSTFATLSEQNFEPEGVAFDLAGNLFVMAINDSDPNFASTIFKFTPNGVQSTFATGLTNYPRGLAFDRAGNLFVAEVGENPDPNVPAPGDILKFRPDGVGTVFAQNIVPGGNNSGPEFLAFQPR